MEQDGAEAPRVCRAGVKTAAGAKGRAEQAGRPGEARRAAFIGTTRVPEGLECLLPPGVRLNALSARSFLACRPASR